VALNGKAFLITESGAPALDARSNPMIVGPQPVTAGLAELGCNLLAQTSRVHVLTGPGAKVGCCLPKYGATEVSKVACRVLVGGLDECTPAGRTAAAMVDGYIVPVHSRQPARSMGRALGGPGKRRRDIAKKHGGAKDGLGVKPSASCFTPFKSCSLAS